MSEMEVNAEEGTEATEPSVSEVLIAAREAKGLEQKDVAEELFLTTTFIRYIDEGAFEKLPKPAFIKGYLRSYARVVGLQGNEIVEAYEREQQVTPQPPQIGYLTEDPVGPGNFTGPVVQTGVIGLVGLLVVGGLVWWIASDNPAEEIVVTAPARSAPEVSESVEVTPPTLEPTLIAPGPAADTDVGGVEVAPPVAVAETPDSRPVTESAPAANDDAPALPLDDGTPRQLVREVSENPAVQIERVRDGDTHYITVYAGGEQEMEFVFTDECWVEIEDANGEKIYGDLNRAGDVMTVYGSAPFDVLFGRAPAVRMSYEGQSVDLQQFTTGDQTARVRTARL